MFDKSSEDEMRWFRISIRAMIRDAYAKTNSSTTLNRKYHYTSRLSMYYRLGSIGIICNPRVRYEPQCVRDHPTSIQ